MHAPSWRVADEEAGCRLDRFLAAAGRLGSRGRALAAIERGKVFVGDAEAAPADAARRLAPGEVVRVWMDRPGSSRRRIAHPTPTGPLRIVFEDDALVVVDKPAGLLAVPLARRDTAPSVQRLLQDHLRSRGKRRPLVVHRIDRDTSGLVLFATRAASTWPSSTAGRRRRRAPGATIWCGTPRRWCRRRRIPATRAGGKRAANTA
jgi:23S rRNA pseudouridine1911/1915/1917 synthase